MGINGWYYLSQTKRDIAYALFASMTKNYVSTDDQFRLFSALKSAEMFLDANNIEFAKLALRSAIRLYLILQKEWDEKRQRA